PMSARYHGLPDPSTTLPPAMRASNRASFVTEASTPCADDWSDVSFLPMAGLPRYFTSELPPSEESSLDLALTSARDSPVRWTSAPSNAKSASKSRLAPEAERVACLAEPVSITLLVPSAFALKFFALIVPSRVLAPVSLISRSSFDSNPLRVARHAPPK